MNRYERDITGAMAYCERLRIKCACVVTQNVDDGTVIFVCESADSAPEFVEDVVGAARRRRAAKTTNLLK